LTPEEDDPMVRTIEVASFAITTTWERRTKYLSWRMLER